MIFIENQFSATFLSNEDALLRAPIIRYLSSYLL